jgi:signal transduction histidine kinase
MRRGGLSVAALAYVGVAPLALVWLAPAGAASWVAAFAALYAAVGGLLLRALLSAPRPLTASSSPHDEPALSREDRDRLAALVRERTAELEAARTLAEDTNRAKTLFLANMSHELRTPMHAVLSYAQLGRDARNPGEQRDYFERIAERGHALLHLLSDLLDLSRLESGNMSMEFAPHDLEALFRDAFKQAEPAFRAKRVSSEFKRTPDCAHASVRVDAVRIGQVFNNILANAVRFSPEGGHVRALLSPATLPAGRGSSGPRKALAIAISDEGVGIPEAELEMIFDKFVESSKTRTNAGGTGLGLAICRQIVALHEGAVVASNNSGPGATMRVVLPLAVSVTTERHAEERGTL